MNYASPFIGNKITEIPDLTVFFLNYTERIKYTVTNLPNIKISRFTHNRICIFVYQKPTNRDPPSIFGN